MTISRFNAIAFVMLLTMLAPWGGKWGGEWGGVFAEAPAPEADPQVVDWLDQLEERGQAIRTLTGSVSYARVDELLGEEQVRIGKLWYVAADDEDDQPARFAVHFNQLVIDDALRQQDRHFIFDGEWLVEKQPDRKLFQKRQVVPPGESFDPLQVDGPFPMPIGQRRDDVLARFNVELIEPEPDHEHLVHLKLTPRDDVPRGDGEADFDRVDMWFHRETLLPERVETRQGHHRTTVALYDKEVDEMSKQQIAERFDVTAPDSGSGWRVEITPYEG
ncbi:MAG: hypothetical protein WD294_07825 [Phycisphaeraceae bacterium]